MMTFYLGDEAKIYKKKFEDLKQSFMKRANETSNAGIFRFIIDILHKDLKRREKEELDKPKELEIMRQEIDKVNKAKEATKK